MRFINCCPLARIGQIECGRGRQVPQLLATRKMEHLIYDIIILARILEWLNALLLFCSIASSCGATRELFKRSLILILLSLKTSLNADFNENLCVSVSMIVPILTFILRTFCH